MIRSYFPGQVRERAAITSGPHEALFPLYSLASQVPFEDCICNQ